MEPQYSAQYRWGLHTNNMSGMRVNQEYMRHSILNTTALKLYFRNHVIVLYRDKINVSFSSLRRFYESCCVTEPRQDDHQLLAQVCFSASCLTSGSDDDYSNDLEPTQEWLSGSLIPPTPVSPLTPRRYLDSGHLQSVTHCPGVTMTGAWTHMSCVRCSVSRVCKAHCESVFVCTSPTSTS